MQRSPNFLETAPYVNIEIMAGRIGITYYKEIILIIHYYMALIFDIVNICELIL